MKNSILLTLILYCMTGKSQEVKPDSLRSKNYQCTVEAGYTEVIAWDGSSHIVGFSADVTESHVLTRHVTLGAGVGGNVHDRNTGTLSVYADSRVYFKKNDISPFLDLVFGYCSFFSDNYGVARSWPKTNLSSRYRTHMDASQGLIFNPAIGLRVLASKHICITASLGYRLYYLHTSDNFIYTYSFRENQNATYALGHAYVFRAGFQF